jgi:hypothetical protein
MGQADPALHCPAAEVRSVATETPELGGDLPWAVARRTSSGSSSPLPTCRLLHNGDSAVAPIDATNVVRSGFEYAVDQLQVGKWVDWAR